ELRWNLDGEGAAFALVDADQGNEAPHSFLAVEGVVSDGHFRCSDEQLVERVEICIRGKVRGEVSHAHPLGEVDGDAEGSRDFPAAEFLVGEQALEGLVKGLLGALAETGTFAFLAGLKGEGRQVGTLPPELQLAVVNGADSGVGADPEMPLQVQLVGAA